MRPCLPDSFLSVTPKPFEGVEGLWKSTLRVNLTCSSLKLTRIHTASGFSHVHSMLRKLQRAACFSEILGCRFIYNLLFLGGVNSCRSTGLGRIMSFCRLLHSCFILSQAPVILLSYDCIHFLPYAYHKSLVSS